MKPPFALSCSQEPLSPDAPSRQVRVLLDALAALSDPDGVFCVGETGDLGVRLTIARHSGDAREAFVVRDSVAQFDLAAASNPHFQLMVSPAPPACPLH
jgi:hypothetical protein